ncbi:hypothetical protein [Nitrosomonas communis]|uniref:hypothetical protein n=1 Tax=Nitrosomonas communis TaxID=44574 RepID=UPI0026E945AC|nr:hypothetical protein [Nitrosomonas communis]MCO6426988.1 hypothetical protein [Nitrosomonas communis]
MSQLYAKLHISPGYAVRKDFTDSERVAIGRAIEESLAWRKGTNQYTKEDCQNFDNPLVGKRSDEIAAQKAGFNNKETYRQAKSVVDHGVLDQSQSVDLEMIILTHAGQRIKR